MRKSWIKEQVKQVVANGNWMVCLDWDECFGTFKWNPVGEWTEAPDWNPMKLHRHGLYGQDKDHGGHCKVIDYFSVKPMVNILI